MGQVEKELRESEERYRALVTATSDIVYRMSPDWSEMRRLHGKSFIADTEKPNRNWLAHAADRAIPALLNLANQGQSWRENGISHERVVNRFGPPIKAGCPALWEYLEARLHR